MPVEVTHDLARVDLKKDTLDTPVDQLTLAIEKDNAGGGVLKIMWANTQYSVTLKAAPSQLDLPQLSPTETLKQRIGLTDIQVVYSRPSARGRVMLGGNNPYGEVWRTGANNATRISFSTPVTLAGLERCRRHLRALHDPRQGRVDPHPPEAFRPVGRLRL